MASLGQATLKTGADLSGLKSSLSKGKSLTDRMLGSWGTAFSMALGSVMASAFGMAVGAIKDAVMKSLDFAMTAVMAAARIEELDAVVKTIGINSGKTAAEMDKVVASIKDTGIETSVAQKLAIQFVRYNLDLADATALATVAQDSAVIAMQDSSVALDGLMHGIVTMNKRVLRTYGINVTDVNTIMKEHAKVIGVTVKEMTQAEKMQGYLNAVIAEGAAIQGAYTAAMDKAGKKLRSLKGREIKELMNILGGPFLKIFGMAIDKIREFVKFITLMAGEGKPLNRMLVALGSILESVVHLLFRDIEIDTADAEESLGRVALFFERIAGFLDLIEIGAWKTAIDILFGAMPGKPVEMAEKLKKQVAGLIDVFGLVKAGDIEGVLQAFNIRQDIIDKIIALNDGILRFVDAIQRIFSGDVRAGLQQLGIPQDVIDRGMQFVEKVGDKLVPIIEKISKWVDDHGEEIKQFFEAFAGVLLAVIGAKVAIGIIGAIAAVLGFLVGPLIGLATALLPFLAVAGIIALVATAWKENWGGIRDTVIEVIDRITPRLEEIKEGVERFVEAVGLIKSGDVEGGLRKLGIPQDVIDRGTEFVEKVGEKIGPIIEEIGAWIETHGDEITEFFETFSVVLLGIIAASAVTGVIGAIAGVIGTLATAVGGLMVAAAPILAIAGIIALVYLAWKNNWGGIRDIITDVVDNKILPLVEKVKVWFEENWPLIQAIFLTAWTVIKDNFLAAWDVLKPAFDELIATFQAFFTPERIQAFKDIFGAVMVAVGVAATILGAIIQAAFGIVVAVIGAIIGAVGTLIDWFGMLIDAVARIINGIVMMFSGDLLGGLKEIFGGLKDYIVGTFVALKDLVFGTIGDLVTGVIDFFKNLYDRLVGHSIIPDMVNKVTSWIDKISGVFETVKGIIDGVIETFKTLGRKIGDLKDKLPDWLIPGSATPLERGLIGIHDAMKAINKSSLPGFGEGFGNLAGMVTAIGGTGDVDKQTTETHNHWELQTVLPDKGDIDLRSWIRIQRSLQGA